MSRVVGLDIDHTSRPSGPHPGRVEFTHLYGKSGTRRHQFRLPIRVSYNCTVVRYGRPGQRFFGGCAEWVIRSTRMSTVLRGPR